MDYEKKYNEALKLAASYYGDGANEFLDTIFPELAESEDERIRKEIKQFILDTIGEISLDDKENAWLTYLEKLKEFPFVKDVVLGYPGLYFYDGERMHFQGNPAMEEKQKEQEIPLMNGDADLYFDNFIQHNDATKRGFFMEGIKYAQRLQKEQQPAEWSEEDEEMIGNIISSLRGYMCLASKSPYYTNHETHIQKEIEFLNILPERFSPQPKQEWSEEDEEMMTDIIESLEYAYPNDNEFRIAWLKSLRPHWKPSEEHLSALLAVFNDPNNIGSQTCQLALTDLYEQLKKLM